MYLCYRLVTLIDLIRILILLVADSEDGMLVLQALVEGSVLEAHPTGALSPEDRTPYLELYTQAQYGSDVWPSIFLF